MDLASYLRANGFSDTPFWLEQLRKMGIESKESLELIERDLESFTDLEKVARYKVEKKALRKLLKIDETEKAKESERKDKKEKEKQKRVKKKEKAKQRSKEKKAELRQKEVKAQEILENLERARSEGKDRHDTRVKKLEDDMREALNISPDHWISKDKSLDELISKLEERHQVSQQLIERSSLDDSMLLQTVSGGRALHGVLLTKVLEDQLDDSKREQLLTVPEEVLITGDSQAHDKIVQFSFEQQEDTFKKKVDVLGHSVAVSASAPVYGAKISLGTSTCDSTENESNHESHIRETYSSTVKYSTVQVASYSFKRKDLKLSDDAKHDLHQIQSLMSIHGSNNNNVKTACKRFFKTYGSHVNRGPLKFGGNFWWSCTSRGFQKKETETVKKMQNEAISTSAGVAYLGFGVSTEVNIDKVKGSYQGRCSASTLASTRLQVKITGGPPEATDLPQWKSGLVANNSTWILTDRGGKLIPVWDIIRRNHEKELGGIVDTLREAWENMTGLQAEQDLALRLSYDLEAVMEEVSEWNEKDTLMPRQIEDNLNYLLKVKKDIVDKTGSKSIWVNECLLDVSLQEFLVAVVDLATPEFGHIKFITQSLVEHEEIGQLDTRTFPEIDRLNAWIYDSQQPTAPRNLTVNIEDFESFDNFLEKTLEEERLSQVNSGKLFSETSEDSKQRLSAIVSKAIYSLRSHYQQTYDDILITILIHPFQSSSYDSIITLRPISLEDLESLRRQFFKWRAEFNQCLSKQRPLSLQAFLYKLAIDVCQDKSDLKPLMEEITQVMKTLQPPLDQELLQFLDQPASILEENLQYLMTKPLYSKPSHPKKNGDYSSLKNVLKTVSQQHVLPHVNMAPVLKKNPAVRDLFEKLGVTSYYPQNLHLKDALCIRPGPLKLSLNNTPPSDLEHLPFLVLHKIMVYDVQCRSNLMMPSSLPDNNSKGSQDDDDDDEYEDYDEYEEDAKSKTSTYGVNPVDVILALFLCSDDLLRQDLLSRLAKCQLSVPFILQDPFTKQLTIPLWALRSIIKDWKSTKADGSIEPQTNSIVSYPMPIISFIGFGKQKQGKSKSGLLNEVISDSQNHFFHRDCAGGHYNCLLGQGLVDMCWYLPAGQASDIFPDAVTFLNLHGDARHYPQQSKFLGQISSICVVLLTEEVKASDTEIIKTLKMFSLCPGGIILLDTVGKKPEVIMKEVRGAHAIKLTDKNASDIKRTIRGQIRKKLKTITEFQKIESCCTGKKIFTDEDSDICKESFALAIKVKNSITGNKVGTKDAILPLQGPDWQNWAENDREYYRQSSRGAKNVNDYTAEITKNKEDLRMRQFENIESLTVEMKAFLETLLTLEGPSNTVARNYFLQCLKLELNNISRESISGMQQQYQDTKRQLAKLQDKTASQTSDVKNKIATNQKKLRELQDKIIGTSVGLEHLFRELGQVYEAAMESPMYSTDRNISRLPKAAAELLIDGYPIEVVDGDAAHVPLKWFTAVFEEAVRILDNPKVFVLSVLGLQSTGKSTMLNTAFGLQFNVSAGRCTRGAFIQLLSLDEELKQTTKCSYVLVVDTEGLRAPELDPLKTQKHDNELATFVIGLANMTLINIYGEVPGDMDDILQTSVHAFLRMTQVKYHPSCQFVHQNAGSNVKSEVGRSKFTEKLNKFTVDAAHEENVEGQFETFNDVIKFDSERDVHHFQGLWKGDPPMAPVNQGYSHCAQKLKLSCVEILQKRAGDLDLSSFRDKVGKLWQNLLKENFVFSFKNTLEITAYNSLEAEYSKWDWEFREGMLEWEQKLENQIKAADSKSVPEIVEKKRSELRLKVIPELYQPIKEEKMDVFFKGKQADILIQWKKRFETRLNSLRFELQEHAEKHCTKLRQSTEAISKIKSEQTEYAKKITERVKEYIASIKYDQEQLSQNLESGQLDSHQLREILDKEPFTHEKVDFYQRKKIIVPDQASHINGIVRRSGGQLSESELSSILFGGVVAKEQVKSILKTCKQTKKQLKATFDQLWIDLVNQIPCVTGETINIENEVETMLFTFLYSSQGKLVESLKDTSLAKVHNLHLKLEEGKHYNKVKSGNIITRTITRIIRGEVVESSHYHIEALEMMNRVFDVARSYLKAVEKKDTDFNTAFTQELLRELDKKIAAETAAIKDRLTFTHEFKLDVYRITCGYAIPVFTKMSESFKERHDPRLYLDKYVKGPLYTQFENQYNQAEAEEAIASTLCAHLQEPIKNQVRIKIGGKMVGLMKGSDQRFSSKMALKVKILTDLQEEDKFEKYMEYILDVKGSILKWIKHYTIKFCDEKVAGGTRLQVTSREIAKDLVEVVEGKLNFMRQASVQQLVRALCDDSDLKEEFGINLNADDLLAGYEFVKDMSLENFKGYTRSGLKALKEDINASFNDIHCESEMSSWRDKPHDILESLIGCTAQCPFCNEQCDLLHADHYPGEDHRTAVHRSTCLAGFKDKDTRVMSIGFCPAYVAGQEEHTGFRDHRTNGVFHPYKDYKSKHPEWSIPPDATSSNSLYWKKFVGRYINAIATKFSAKPASVPSNWSTTSREKVLENLASIYNTQ